MPASACPRAAVSAAAVTPAVLVTIAGCGTRDRPRASSAPNHAGAATDDPGALPDDPDAATDDPEDPGAPADVRTSHQRRTPSTADRPTERMFRNR
jgi:hypothetical protein